MNILLPTIFKLESQYFRTMSTNKGALISLSVRNDLNSYNLVLPSSNQAGQLTNDGNGLLTWVPASGGTTDIDVNNATTDGLMKITQRGSGDSNIRFQIDDGVPVNYIMGMDNTDDKFKIANSTDLGTNTKISIDGAETTIHNTLTVGNYSLPPADGTVGQYLITDGLGSISWTDLTGIANGGQTGDVILGSSTNNLVEIVSDGVAQITVNTDGTIVLGNPAVANDIIISGGIRYSVREDNTGNPTVNIETYDFLLIITNPGTTAVQLPLASTNQGRMYIITKYYVGGTLTILPNVLDTIEGDPSLDITIDNFQSKIISNGINTWHVI